jgi:lysyl-tRNA synthetase class I
VTTPVTGGRCKLQWKPDWAMRWVALGVDYEMAGKDLIDSVKLSGEICRALGGVAPEGFNYELFLDEKGQKISKSKGNGLTIEEWLRYASPESLSLFMYREPKAAKRLYFDVIPRNVDEYHQFLDGYGRQDARQRLSNPVWHIHSAIPRRSTCQSRLRCCSRWCRRRMPRTPIRCGDSSAATVRVSRLRRIPSSMSSSSMPFIISATSSGRRRNSVSQAARSVRP